MTLPDPPRGFLSPRRCGTERTSATPTPKAHRGPWWTPPGRWFRSAVAPTTCCGQRSGRDRPWSGKESTGTIPKVGGPAPPAGRGGGCSSPCPGAHTFSWGPVGISWSIVEPPTSENGIMHVSAGVGVLWAVTKDRKVSRGSRGTGSEGSVSF